VPRSTSDAGRAGPGSSARAARAPAAAAASQTAATPSRAAAAGRRRRAAPRTGCKAASARASRAGPARPGRAALIASARQARSRADRCSTRRRRLTCRQTAWVISSARRDTIVRSSCELAHATVCPSPRPSPAGRGRYAYRASRSRWVSVSAIASNTPDHSPRRCCRKIRIDGYQGLSVRPAIQRKQPGSDRASQTGRPMPPTK